MFISHEGEGMEVCDVCECVIVHQKNVYKRIFIDKGLIDIQTIKYGDDLYMFCSSNCKEDFFRHVKGEASE